MRFFTRQWFDLLQQSGIEEDPRVEEPPKTYLKLLQTQNIPARILDRMDFHDSEVIKFREDAETLVLEMEEREWGYSHLRFEKPEILKRDMGIEGCEWLYEEVYREGSGYELHVLFYSRKELGLKELILRCREIVID